MHDQLLEALLRIADVRLVASLQAPEFGFPSSNDLRVFIPDLHLCSNARAAAYEYGTNHEDLLVKLLSALTDLKANAGEDETVEVYQIGDYLDLWRENLGPPGPDVPDRIKLDHAVLVNTLESRALKTHFLLGNHDFDLWQWHGYAGWDRRYYIPGPDGRPVLMTLHGDYFDWVERLPTLLKDIGVYVFAPNKPPDAYILGKMQQQAHAWNSQNVPDSQLILRGSSVVGPTQAGALVVPPEWNVQKAAAPGQPQQTADASSLDFLETACAECQKANANFGLQIRTAIIGHTHHARIAVKTGEDGGRFVLIDCGAWIEDCRQFPNDDPAPNAQIAAISANWARIYQLAPEILGGLHN